MEDFSITMQLTEKEYAKVMYLGLSRPIVFAISDLDCIGVDKTTSLKPEFPT